MRPAIQQERLDLAAVDRALVRPGPNTRLLLREHDYAGAAEKFRLLAHRLRRRGQSRSVVVTSAIPKEGKTTFAVNFCIVQARNSRRVLLIDADLRRPSVHRLLGMPELPGLNEVLAGEAELSQSLRLLDPFGLYCLPAGRKSNNPTPLLEGEEFQKLLSGVREAFDWVVIDSPPMVPFADAYFIANRVECVLVVARNGHTRRPELERALAGLEGTAVAGIVPNEFDEPHRDHYYYSYYGNPEPGSR